jgi:hypothetical protein
MKVKITLENLFDAHPAFELLGQQFFYLNKIVEARNLFEEINKHYTAIANKQQELLEFYGTKNESGNYNVADEKKPFFEKELGEFLAAEIELDWTPVNPSKLGDLRMPIPAYELLKFLFTEETVESAEKTEEVEQVS